MKAEQYLLDILAELQTQTYLMREINIELQNIKLLQQKGIAYLEASKLTSTDLEKC